MCTDFCHWKIMNPLYNGAAKHFKLTSLFSFNINFNILYPQLHSTARNHINRLQDNLASELSKVSGIESGSSCARTFCHWKIMNPLYNGAAKHFKLTSLFSFNINFNILYPQLYSTARNHINRLQDNLASELSKVF